MDGSGELQVRLRQVAPFPMSIEFRAPPGSVTALFGPSGSGKSTVLRAIAGLHRSDDALVACGGQRWTDTAAGAFLPAHCRPVGFVFQDYALFPHLTVREQLALAIGHRPRGERAARIEALLALARLEGLAGRKPAALSGGEQQRVALARALARDPSVLLLDEPSAGLSPANQDEVFVRIAEVNQAGVSVVMVEQNARRCLEVCHRGYVLDQGANAYTGTGRSLLEDKRVVELYLGTLARVR